MSITRNSLMGLFDDYEMARTNIMSRLKLSEAEAAIVTLALIYQAYSRANHKSLAFSGWVCQEKNRDQQCKAIWL